MAACESTVSTKPRWHKLYGSSFETRQWVKGVVVTLTILGLFITAAVRSISTRPAVNERCLKEMA